MSAPRRRRFSEGKPRPSWVWVRVAGKRPPAARGLCPAPAVQAEVRARCRAPRRAAGRDGRAHSGDRAPGSVACGQACSGAQLLAGLQPPDRALSFPSAPRRGPAFLPRHPLASQPPSPAAPANAKPESSALQKSPSFSHHVEHRRGWGFPASPGCGRGQPGPPAWPGWAHPPARTPAPARRPAKGGERRGRRCHQDAARTGAVVPSAPLRDAERPGAPGARAAIPAAARTGFCSQRHLPSARHAAGSGLRRGAPLEGDRFSANLHLAAATTHLPPAFR